MKKKIETGLCILAGGIFMVSCLWSFWLWYGYHKGDAEYDLLYSSAVSVEWTADKTVHKETGGEKNESVKADQEYLFIDFPVLQSINPEVVGWIDFPGLTVSYPVVQGENNQIYLKRTFRGEHNAAGAIFMDNRNCKDLTDQNTVIYGHNMKNGSMFGMLKRYQDETFYQDHPYFYYYTQEDIYRCDIVGIYSVQADISEYPVTFKNDEEYAGYQKKVLKRSLIKTPTEVAPADRLITLSTCNNKESTRFVVQAKLNKCSNK